MNQAQKHGRLPIFIVVGCCLMSAAGQAQTRLLTLTPSSVIGGSGSYEDTSYSGVDSGINFTAGNVFDSQSASSIAETNQTNADVDGGYWLGRQGIGAGYFVVDLGQLYILEYFEIFNTHNCMFDDRGTGYFQISGSESLHFSPRKPGSDLTGIVTCLADGTLDFPKFNKDPIKPQVAKSGYSPVRYLRFNATIANGLWQGVGLNELKVYGKPVALSNLTPGL